MSLHASPPPSSLAPSQPTDTVATPSGPSKHRHRLWQAALRRQQAGLSALEFALVAPLVLLIIFATLEFALVMMADVSLEAAVSRAQRDSQYHWSEPHACLGDSGAVHSNVLAHLSGWVTHPSSLRVEPKQVLPSADPPAPGSRLPCNDLTPGWTLFDIKLERAGVLGVLNSFGLRVFRLNRTLIVRNLP